MRSIAIGMLKDTMFFGGLTASMYGLSLVSFPACLIVGGALSVAIAFVIARR